MFWRGLMVSLLVAFLSLPLLAAAADRGPVAGAVRRPRRLRRARVRRVYGEPLAVAALKLAAVGLANLVLLIVAARAVVLLKGQGAG